MLRKYLGAPKEILAARKTGGRIRSKQLILCVLQGEVTESNYLLTLAGICGTSHIEITLDGNLVGSDPLKLAHYTLNRYKDTPYFDQVYCLFDRDTFPQDNFDNALIKFSEIQQRENERAASEEEEPRIFKAIVSNPCFELWLIQHFQYFSKPPCSGTDKSPCNQISKALEEIIRKDRSKPKFNYSKGANIFDGKDAESIKAMLKNAINHSVRLKKSNEASGASCPVTNMHELVQVIIDASSRQTKR